MSHTYIQMRKNAVVLRKDRYYNLSLAEMNPAIIYRFLVWLKAKGLLEVVWEPFAGGAGSFWFCRTAVAEGFRAICHSPHHVSNSMFRRLDSTENGPDCPVGGILWHPPYFGSSQQSDAPWDVSRLHDEEDYKEALKKAANLGIMKLVNNGMVCAVGRDYRVNGKRIRLDEWYLEVFDSLNLVDVWSSEPDTVLLFEVTK